MPTCPKVPLSNQTSAMFPQLISVGIGGCHWISADRSDTASEFGCTRRRRRPVVPFCFCRACRRDFSSGSVPRWHRGHGVHRVNFNGGDRVFWRLPNSVDFPGHEYEWPQFLDRLITERAISDIILFGDCRPLHRAAIRLAERRQVLVHVVEEGYMRPDWITFEPGGVNGYSSLPKDPDWYRERARDLPEWQRPPTRAGPVSGGERSKTCSIISRRWQRCCAFLTTEPTAPIISSSNMQVGCAGWR